MEGTPASLQDDAAGTAWEVTLPPVDFEALRGRYPIGQVIHRRNEIGARYISAELRTRRPWP